MRPPKLNSVEPPRYGPVCQVVWEGRCRDASPISINHPILESQNGSAVQKNLARPKVRTKLAYLGSNVHIIIIRYRMLI